MTITGKELVRQIADALYFLHAGIFVWRGFQRCYPRRKRRCSDVVLSLCGKIFKKTEIIDNTVGISFEVGFMEVVR